jgi:putative N-acetylmannosamine-6-phosphate epimerase
MKKSKCFFAFTSTCYAYDKSENKVKKRLLDELSKNNIKPNRFAIADVSHLEEGIEISCEPWEAIADGKKLKLTVKQF